MSSSMQITPAKKFNSDEIKYKPPTTNNRGGKDVKVQLKGSNLVLQVPLMLTWVVMNAIMMGDSRMMYHYNLNLISIQHNKPHWII